MRTLPDGVLFGFGLIIGIAAALLLCLTVFFVLDTLRNFVLRYQQAAQYDVKGVRARSKWAAKMILDYGLIL